MNNSFRCWHIAEVALSSDDVGNREQTGHAEPAWRGLSLTQAV
jgi:hypothetical protein